MTTKCWLTTQNKLKYKEVQDSINFKLAAKRLVENGVKGNRTPFTWILSNTEIKITAL